MKHYILIATMALVSIFAFSSCSDDVTVPSSEREGEVTTSITVGLPQSIQTYATSSALGGLANLLDQNLKVRYILEVYPKNSTELAKRMICYKDLKEGVDFKLATFSNIRLVAAEYNFVFWADIVRSTTQIDDAASPDLNDLITVANGVCGNRYLVTPIGHADGSCLEDAEAIIAYNTGINDHYELTNLQNIQVANVSDSHFKPVNGEMNDAYRNVTPVDLRTDAPIGTIELKRPFAKLRVIATDADALADQNIDWKKTEVRPSLTSADMPSTFNVLSNEASGSISSFKALQSSLVDYTDPTTGDTNKQKTVGVWYYLAPTQNPNLSLNININVPGLSSFGGVDIGVGNIPLVENKVTTIKGNIFSKNTNVTIFINDEFDPDNTGDHEIELKKVSTPEELMSSLSGKSENITYTGTVTKSDGLTLNFNNLTRSAGVYEEGNTAVLSLNIPNIEDGALITIIGADNVPSKIILNTGTKCSLRVNAPKTFIDLYGREYGYIAYNSGMLCDDTTIDALFLSPTEKSNWFYPTNISTCHRITLGDNFAWLEDASCKKHKTECEFVNMVKTWLSNNSNKTVWDFVKEYQPETPAE